MQPPYLAKRTLPRAKLFLKLGNTSPPIGICTRSMFWQPECLRDDKSNTRFTHNCKFCISQKWAARPLLQFPRIDWMPRRKVRTCVWLRAFTTRPNYPLSPLTLKIDNEKRKAIPAHKNGGCWIDNFASGVKSSSQTIFHANIFKSASANSKHSSTK